MPSVSLIDCIHQFQEQPHEGRFGLEHDKEGWHVVDFENLKKKPSVEEIYRDINILNKEETEEIINTIVFFPLSENIFM